MTKKVDLVLLLNKKYDKPDEITYRTLMEEIDTVLENKFNYNPYTIKIDDPGNTTMEQLNTISPPGTSHQIATDPMIPRASPHGEGDNSHIPQVTAAKLAERDTTAISKINKTANGTQEYKVIVPDMMQLLFEGGAVPKGEDKNIVDAIIDTIPGKNWANKINYIDRLLNDNLTGKEKKYNFQSMVSALVTLNCLKKIAFDVGNLSKGGLFEYFMAKLMGAKFDVVPADNPTVIDIAEPQGDAFSLKLLGNYRNVSMRGSRQRLGENTVNYIIGQVSKDKGENNKIVFYVIKFTGIKNMPKDTSHEVKDNIIYINLDYQQNTQFVVDLKSTLDKLGKVNAKNPQINFGDMNSYNSRLNDIVKMYQNTVHSILSNLTQLNDNLTKYLSVKKDSKSPVPENGAIKAVDNAKNIVQGVNSMRDSSG